MLSGLQIFNFRKFDRFSIRLKSGNVLVGPNNSGKSSILEAFKLLEACFRFIKTKSPLPMSTGRDGVCAGYHIPDTTLPFSSRNISRDYNTDETRFEFLHENGNKIIISIQEDRKTILYLMNPGKLPRTTSAFRGHFPLDIIIVPTLSPLEAEEFRVTDETVRRNSQTHLASRVFRNIWLRQSNKEFEDFRLEIEQSWPDVSLEKPTMQPGDPSLVTMFFRENRITREIQWAGFGFQVWLQIQTHLSRTTDQAVLIIDEPDVYLHPDLQRRLLQRIKSKFKQFILATHAAEIINEAELTEIVAINAKYKTAKRIGSSVEFHDLHRYIGSSENTEFARLAKARRVIFVEGADAKLLRKFAAKLGYKHLGENQTIPIIKLGGFSEWKRADAAAWFFKHILDVDIEVFCIFDRDFRSDEEVTAFIADRGRAGVRAHVFSRKEIENYLLIPEALQRVLEKRLSDRGRAESVSIDDVNSILISLAAEFKEKILGQLAASYLRQAEKNRSSVDMATIIARCSKEIDVALNSIDGICRFVPGKDYMSLFRKRIQDQYSVSFSEFMIIEQINKTNAPGELVALLAELDEFCAKATVE